MKRLFLIPAALVLFLAVDAQQEIVVAGRPLSDTAIKPNHNKDQKVITLRFKGEITTDKKYLIEVDGDKIKVNGKDLSEMKDVDVSIGKSRIYLNGMGSGNAHVFTTPGMHLDQFPREEMKKRFDEVREMRLENRALLGINMEKTESGVRILDVTPNSGAEKAGLKKDDIVVSMDGKKIGAEMDITKIVGEHKPGDEVDVVYKRDGKEKKVKAVLGKREPSDMAFWFDQQKGNSLNLNGQAFDMAEKFKELELNRGMNNNLEFKLAEGMELPADFHEKLNGITVVGMNRPRLGVNIKETESGKGLEVTEVDENSVAAKAGIKKGDIITEVAGKPVNSVDDIRKLVTESKSKPFNLQYNRNGSSQNVEIKFPKKLKEGSL